MSIHKLTTTDAFIAFDLDDASAVGVVRSAPKILQGGAKDLARSLTYALATLEIRRGGASAGINAKPDERVTAVTAFVNEISTRVAAGELSIDAGKGVDEDQLSPLSAQDDRHELRHQDVGGQSLAAHLEALGPVVAAVAALGGLEGKSVAIEGFAQHGPALAAAATDRGAKVTGVSTTAGTVTNTDGLDVQELHSGWADRGPALVGEAAEPPWKIFALQADVLFVGSKMGAINHDTAAGLRFSTVVPHSPLPYTARALAVMQRSDTVVLPDFITTAAPLVAYWPVEPSPEAVIAEATSGIIDAVTQALAHGDGPFLGGSYRAEAFLASWRDQLPFGRPLAS